MAGNGPRVGAAHIDTTMEFDAASMAAMAKTIEKEIKKTAKKTQSSLSRMASNIQAHFDSIARHNRAVYRGIGQNAVTAWRSMLGIIVTMAPLASGAVSGLAGGVTLLAGALYSTVQASSAAVGALGALGVAALTAKIGFEGFADAVKASDPEELEEALKNLSPAARQSALAVRSLRDEAKQLRLAVQERMFKGLNDDIARTGEVLLPVLEDGLVKVSAQLNKLFEDLLRYTGSERGLRQISKVLENSAGIFRRLRQAAVPFLDGALRLFNALAPASKRFADRVAEVAENFQEWTKSDGFGKRLDDTMKKAEKTAGLLLKVVGNIGGAISNIFNAANPATNTFLQMLVDLTQRFEDWTGSVEGQNSIAQWAEDSIDILVAMGGVLEEVGEFFARLGDPRIIISFLDTLEGAFEILNRLPLEKIASGIADIAEALDPISAPLLAAIIGFTTFNILLGSIVGQVAGFASTIGKVVGGIGKGVGRLFSTIFPKGGGKHVAEIGRMAKIFKNLGGVLKGLGKGAGPIGLLVTLGLLVKDSEKLQGTLKDLGGAIGDAFGKLAESAGEIWTSLQPVFDGLKKAFGPAAAQGVEQVSKSFEFLLEIFERLEPVMEFIANEALQKMIQGFEGLGGVFEGLGDIISGFIDTVVGIFEGDMGKIREGMEKTIGGIGTLFGGLLKMLGGFLAPGQMVQYGVQIIMWLWQGIQSAWGYVSSAFQSLIYYIPTYLSSLGSRLLAAGRAAFNMLVTPIKEKAAQVQAAVGVLVDRAVNALQALPEKLRGIAARAMNWLATAIDSAKEKAGAAIDRVKTRIENRGEKILTWFTELPGKIETAIGDLSTLLLSAGSDLIAGLKQGIGDAWDDVVGYLEGLAASLPGPLKKVLGISSPSKVFAGIGKDIVAGLVKGLRGDSDDVTEATNNMLNAIDKALNRKNKKKRITENAAKFMRSVVEAMGKAAQDATDRLTERANYAQQLTDSFRGEFDITSMLRGGIGNLTANVSSLTARISQFGGKLKALAAAGIPSGLIQEVAGLGSKTGTKVADSLLASSAAQRKALASAWAGFETASSSAGNTGANLVMGTVAEIKAERDAAIAAITRAAAIRGGTMGGGKNKKGKGGGGKAGKKDKVSGRAVQVNNNYYGPTTGRERMNELQWTMRHSTKARKA